MEFSFTPLNSFFYTLEWQADNRLDLGFSFPPRRLFFENCRQDELLPALPSARTESLVFTPI